MGIIKNVFKMVKKNIDKSSQKQVNTNINAQEISYEEISKCLKEFRIKIAKREKIIPYMVFTDETLKYLIDIQPKSKEEFLNIKGLGLKKFEIFGEELIDIFKVNKYIIKINEQLTLPNSIEKRRNVSKKNIEMFRIARNTKAMQLGIVNYALITNKTIYDLLLQEPKSKEELGNIYGLGKIKIEKYGDWILEVLKTVNEEVNTTIIKKEEYIELFNDEDINNKFQQMINDFNNIYFMNEFISRKMLNNIENNYKQEITVIKNSLSNNSLKLIAKKYDINIKELEKFAVVISDLYKNIEVRNQAYIEYKLLKEKLYLDNVLRQVDKNINLDKNQRISILNDEDYSLVLAGAGAGKTTTVAAKVKYLVDKKNIQPNEILVVSFTNKAVDELKERINKQLSIPCEICTFHKVGLNIVKENNSVDKLKIVHDGLMYNLIKDYLVKKTVENPLQLKDLILFFGYYIDMPTPDLDYEKFFIYQQSQDYTSMKEEIRQINEELINKYKKIKKTIKNEIMRSIEEVQIANFLYLNNVEYEYEAAYPYYIDGSDKLYTPDFTLYVGDIKIYLEHYGIHENGTHNRYKEEELARYKSIIDDKTNLHKRHQTELITTYSYYNDDIPLIDHLKEELERHNVPLDERSPQEVFNEIMKEENNKYFSKFIILIIKFISNFKTSGFSEIDFDRLYNGIDNVRSKLFLKLCKPIYLYYQGFLSENDYTDFEDMINNSTTILKNAKNDDFKNKYKYIIVDEYQDISSQRFNLTKELADKTDAKIIAVGDDWQSIYAFAGSKITLFTKFREEMGYADYLTIDYTYRNAQEVIDAAGAFVQKNNTQLRKQLKSPKHIKQPFVFYEYNDYDLKDNKKGKKGVTIEKAIKLDEVIGKIVSFEGENAEILLLVRYNFEIKQLVTHSDLFYEGQRGSFLSKKYPKVKLTILTVHKSKGLGFDNVIILNGSDEYFGFPSQIEMDPLLSMVIYDDKSYKYAEERRLFYVALTRTKNRVFILYPASKPSAFIREMVEDYKDVTLRGNIVSKKSNRKVTKCPVCGYPLQFKNNKTYGLNLYMCTNEVELCGFISNNLKGGRTSIQKCDKCKDGFLIIKTTKNENVFLGCTNYKANGNGCNNSKNIINN